MRSERDTSIHGSVRITLQAPEEQVPCVQEPCEKGKVPRKVATDLDYCLNSCSQDGAGDCTGDLDQDLLLCPAVYSNAAFVQYPSLEGQGAVFLTTRVDSMEQRVGPPGDNSNCQRPDASGTQNPSDWTIRRSTDKACLDWHSIATQSWYISQIEDYLVKIDHSMLASKVALTRTGYQMDEGEMLAHVNEDGDVQGVKDPDPVLIDPCDDFEPRSSCPTPAVAGMWGVNVGDKAHTDVVKVKTLLRAAGLSANALDEPGASAGSDKRRLRHRGIVLMLNIDYDNTYSRVWGFMYPDTDKYRYRYSVINVPDEGYEVTELHKYDQLEGTRTIFLRHGIRIVLKQTGTIGAFSFASALTTCTTSLGLFAVANLIVDLLLEHLKRFSQYEQQRMVSTDKHSDKTLKDGLLGVTTLGGRLGKTSSRGMNIPLESTGDDLTGTQSNGSTDSNIYSDAG